MQGLRASLAHETPRRMVYLRIDMLNYVEQCDPGVMTEERNIVYQAVLAEDRPGRRQSERIARLRARRLRQTLAGLLLLEPGSQHADRGLFPIGTVEFCRAWMRATGIPEPAPIDYPECLRDKLGRKVWAMPFDEVPVGWWIKPISTKAWDAHVKLDGETREGTVWAAHTIDPSSWQGEWRVYIIHDKIVGVGRYDELDDEALDFNHAAVQQWVDRFRVSGEAPAGYALDVAVLDGWTALVEVTDGWAIGYYKGTCSPRDYARLLAARWDQIVMNGSRSGRDHEDDRHA